MSRHEISVNTVVEVVGVKELVENWDVVSEITLQILLYRVFLYNRDCLPRR